MKTRYRSLAKNTAQITTLFVGQSVGGARVNEKPVNDAASRMPRSRIAADKSTNRPFADADGDWPTAANRAEDLQTRYADGMDASPRKRAVVEMAKRVRKVELAFARMCESENAGQPF